MPYIVSQKREQPELEAVIGQGAVGANAGTCQPDLVAEGRLLSIEEFYRKAEPIVADCLDCGEACSVAIIDIDRLFRIAESYGNGCADAVLSEFGERLLRLAEQRGMTVAHLGFDQFGVLSAGEDGAAATDSFNQLRQELAAQPIFWEGEIIALTVSIGLADIHGPETFDNYLNAAEQFLFMAKTAGRNQVVSDHTFSVAH